MADDHHEIVIIHRGGHSDHDEHHGGVWKIAFADFMTAMMAFFLVMWLLSVNDKAKTAIVRYFNPIKLVDNTIKKKGLHEPSPDDSPTPSPLLRPGSTPGNGKSPVVGVSEEKLKNQNARLDATMRSNPFAALAEIAGASGDSNRAAPHPAVNRKPAIGTQGGIAFRDPFAPPPPQVARAEDKDDDLLTITPPRKPPQPPAPSQTKIKDVRNEETGAAPSGTDKPSTTAPQAKVKADQDLSKQLMAALGSGSGTGSPDVKVRRTGEGVLVSLTDTSNYTMFSSGSAVPAKRVVLMMETIAKVLASRPGEIIIRGYTDNKPYKGGGRYDNWSLSVDRAQAAHYMLVRGGLPDTRVKSVEGFADRKPLAGVDPSDPVNRRIEILLEDAHK
jgi:chemotaxis protein MotB